MHEHVPPRDPQNVKAWLVGSGIASLATALFLIKDASVPAKNIHIIDVHRETGGGMASTPHGDPDNGYSLPFECNPHFHGSCIERLLSLVPSSENPNKSILETILDDPDYVTKSQAAMARFVKKGTTGPEAIHPKGIQIGLKHRMTLIGLMVENETSIGLKSIEEVFDKTFFETTFWKLWSTTFALQPWHSAIEFQRHLRRYLEDIKSLNNVKTHYHTKYNIVDSIVNPLTTYLKLQGVDFRFNHRVADLRAYPDSDPTTISEIEIMTENGDRELITLDPVDIVAVTLGSSTAGAAVGTNDAAPVGLTSNWEDLLEGDWRLWENLAQKSPKFGNPMNYIPRIQQAMIETFTTTLKGPEFVSAYEKLTRDKPGSGTLLTLSESNWDITITIPHQPVFPDQPENVTVMLGYALKPTEEGNFVKKEMWQCTGNEILQEVLGHLNFDGKTILDNARTIPRGMPLGTAPFLTRGHKDRPAVIPSYTTNIACIGQFAEIPGDTSLEVEYSVRGAQMAVCELMGLPEKPVKPSKSLLIEVFDLLV